MAFADQATLAKDLAFQDRIRVAITTAASNVLGEDKAAMSDQAYGKRQHLAYEVLHNSGGYTERFAWAVVANPAITAVSTDGDLEFTVSSLWDDLSGVTGLDQAE